MDGNIIDKNMTDVLLSPWKWKIVSSLFLPDHTIVTNRRHEEWSRQHRDRHPHREVLVGLSGSCLYGYQQKLYPCNPGTVFLFDAFEEHDNYYAPATNDVCHLWLHLVRDDIYFSIYSVRNGRINTDRRLHDRLSAADMESVLRRCWSELSAPDCLPGPVRRVKIITALMNVVVRILEMESEMLRFSADPQSQGQIIESIKRHISETSGKGLTLDNLARIAGYSKFHFLRVFRKYTGQSVHDYINVCRLKKVTELLQQGQIKKQIAEALGFSCPAAFSRWHKTVHK
jgi:AraC-like DNA-binding protein